MCLLTLAYVVASLYTDGKSALASDVGGEGSDAHPGQNIFIIMGVSELQDLHPVATGVRPLRHINNIIIAGDTEPSGIHPVGFNE